MRILLIILFVISTKIILGQSLIKESTGPNIKLSLLDIFEQAIENGGDTLVFGSNVTIIPGVSNPLFGDKHLDQLLKEKYKNDKRLQVENDRIVIKTTIILDKCAIEDNQWIWLRNFDFKGMFAILNHNDNVTLYFENIVFNQGFRLFTLPSNLGANTNKRCALTFAKCDIRERLYCGYGITKLIIDSTTISVSPKALRKRKSFQGAWDMFPISDTLTTTKSGDKQDIRRVVSFNLGNAEIVSIKNSKLASDGDTYYSTFSLSGSTNYLDIGNNEIDQFLQLNLIVNNKIAISENQFNKGGIDISNLALPQKIKIRWPQLGGKKLVLIEEDQQRGGIYFAKTQSELLNQDLFTDLTKSYQSLLNVFKLHGDQVSMNGCFSELKDIQGEYYKMVYFKYGGFRNYFSWKINRLLKFYSNHGTDPALAVEMSIYIILMFSVFYFFFPSDWDVTSKSELIRNFKDFVTKNEKGYVKPFLKTGLGFLISLTNALTLSLNAFTTLGFGNIPTHGLARYICIVQGFIGWFLLSIFTVALINQVSI